MSEPATGGGWAARITDRNTVLVVAILTTLPTVVLISERLWPSTTVVFLFSLAACLVPATAYSSHWPRRYDLPKAALWGLGGALLVLAVMTGLVVVFLRVLAIDGATIAAFLLVVFTPRTVSNLLGE